jgi:hypothetical protein
MIGEVTYRRIFASYRGVEQLVARWAHNPKVAGSSPVPATQIKGPLIGVFLFSCFNG